MRPTTCQTLTNRSSIPRRKNPAPKNPPRHLEHKRETTTADPNGGSKTDKEKRKEDHRDRAEATIEEIGKKAAESVRKAGELVGGAAGKAAEAVGAT